MKFKNKVVNIDNYKEVFSGYSKDCLEVIRSAILDATPIEPFIEKCKNNPYRLWQIKMGIDEYMPLNLLKYVTDGEILYRLRKVRQEGQSLEVFENIDMLVDQEVLKLAIEWYEKGIDISKYNLSIIPKSSLRGFTWGISKGIDMTVFNVNHPLDSDEIICLAKILVRDKNQDISKYVNKGKYPKSVLSKLSEMSKTISINDINPYVVTGITEGYLDCMINCLKVGIPLDKAFISEDECYVLIPKEIDMAVALKRYGFPYEDMLSLDLELEDKNRRYLEYLKKKPTLRKPIKVTL